jgi:site-specific recombinase XerD
MHDLRHSFASVGVNGGASLPIIGKLLGHAKSSTTEKYAHLAADPVRAVNEAMGIQIAAMLSGNKGTVEKPRSAA